MARQSDPSIRISVFGSTRIRVDGEESLPFPTRHAAAILTLLALAPRRQMTRDEIADILWPDESLNASRRRIREHLYRLRQIVPGGRELVLSDAETIWLSDSLPISVDAIEFERLVKLAAGTSSEAEIAALLSRADALYAGSFAPTLDWPRFDLARERYALIHAECLRALAALLSESDVDRAISYGIRAVESEPLSEDGQEDLIRLHAKSGRVEDARRQYRALERLLRKELDAEPSREITQFVNALPQTGPADPLTPPGNGKRVLGILRWRRRERVYRSVATASVVVALATVLISALWRRGQAHPPPITPEARIAAIIRLRPAPGQPDLHASERANHCLALAELAWNDPDAWWGSDEDIWVGRFEKVDDDVESSLAWLRSHDAAREVQLAGALARYWVFPEERLNKEAHWLQLALDYRIGVPDLSRARALVGLSRYYLLKPRAEATQGYAAAINAYSLYRKCDNLWGEAHALRYVALHEHYETRDAQALVDFGKALQLFVQIRNLAGQAQTYECMSYISPNKAPAQLSPGQQVLWCVASSQLYRKIGNPFGCRASEDYLARNAHWTPLTETTVQAFEALKSELLSWALFEQARNNEVQSHALWIALARIALKTADKHLMANCLWSLGQSSPHTPVFREYVAITMGAYARYEAFDRRNADRHAALRQAIACEGYPDDEAASWRAAVMRGGRMTLEQAARFAASR
jgi:DNA-binding SARP family transcriptional activator